MGSFDLGAHGIRAANVLRNAPPARLYEHALAHEPGTAIASSGALIALSGERTGRSPDDKRLVSHDAVTEEVWWGPVNVGVDTQAFERLRDHARAHLEGRGRLYVVDGFAGWDPNHRIRVRVICERAYHALFMHNMLIRPTPDELEHFGEPDYVIYNAGRPTRQHVDGVSPPTSVSLCLEQGEMVILGTEYAGEMKKGVFTIINHIMPRRGVLSMHCSANGRPRR
ncbi:MAG: phosphoenolpyruvate carboxykinase (ATP) [Halofilum sp. (in: g-proteobacteria)]|nr:phosphoenolpyruvate carboxykinase (ATP) [Halofilum sp. (in: g-proteobacteria)]